jgi:hypothetical protein
LIKITRSKKRTIPPKDTKIITKVIKMICISDRKHESALISLQSVAKVQKKTAAPVERLQ